MWWWLISPFYHHNIILLLIRQRESSTMKLKREMLIGSVHKWCQSLAAVSAIFHYTVCWWHINDISVRQRDTKYCQHMRQWAEFNEIALWLEMKITAEWCSNMNGKGRPNRNDWIKIRITVFTVQCTLVHMRGLGIACRPSVCLSVCPSVTLVDCDHIGWKSWKLITRTISPTSSLFVAKRRST